MNRSSVTPPLGILGSDPEGGSASFPLSRGLPSRVTPAGLGQAHEPVLRPGWPVGSRWAAHWPSCLLWAAAGTDTPQAGVPATTATLRKSQTRTGGQSGPQGHWTSREAPMCPSDPLTHGVLFHTSTTRVCKPHGLCVCVCEQVSSRRLWRSTHLPRLA